MPATSDKDDKQGLVVLPSYGWLALFPYSRSSLFSRYTHFHCFAFFVSFTDVSFLMPGQFWWWRLFTFWERNVPGPLPQRSNRKLESKKFFSMDPGTACHYHGAAGKVDSSGGSFAGFQKRLHLNLAALFHSILSCPEKEHFQKLICSTDDIFVGKCKIRFLLEVPQFGESIVANHSCWSIVFSISWQTIDCKIDSITITIILALLK